MGAAKTPSVEPAPPPPATVIRADAEKRKKRSTAQAEASMKSGVGASDLTKGAMAMTGPALLKQVLGG